jgi:integrase
MRPSEAIALPWADVDLRAERAEIMKSRHLGTEAAPKTRGSRRTVRLKAQTETLTETFEGAGDEESSQVPEKNGATRRSRTGDLLITNQLLCRLS